MEEVLDRFWREALATCRGFPDRAVLFHAAGGSNPVPWLAHRLAGVLYSPIHLSQMAAVLLPVVTEILYNPEADINDPDAWSSRLQSHQYYQLVFRQRLAGAPTSSAPVASPSPVREEPPPSRR